MDYIDISDSSEKIDCSNFVRYEKKKKYKAFSTIEILSGIQAKPRHIHKNIGFNTFEKKLTKIPKEFKKGTITKK